MLRRRKGTSCNEPIASSQEIASSEVASHYPGDHLICESSTEPSCTFALSYLTGDYLSKRERRAPRKFGPRNLGQ